MNHTRKQTTITLDDWIQSGLTFELYKSDRKRGHLKTTGRAAYGKPVTIIWDSLRTDRQEVIKEQIGDPENKVVPGFEQYVEADEDAYSYYSSYRTGDGKALPADVIEEYYANSCVLSAADYVYKMRLATRRKSGGNKRGVWDSVAAEVAGMDRSQWKHTLPGNPRRLRDRMKQFLKKGHSVLIHKGYGNQNRRKVSGDMERLLLSLYCMKNKPYVSYVHELYHQFLGGVIDIYDPQTGEIFNRDDFVDDEGRSIQISDSTVWNYVNLPKNRRIVDKFRSGSLDYVAMHRPHVHRKSPEYSFSKISMDDRDLPRLLKDGKRVKAYYSYDVASGCVVGASYSRKKDTDLFMACMRDMFRFIDQHDLAMPFEVEVEHHLVRNYRDTLMNAGTVFPFVRWCNPGNSQEKRAEHSNRVKKLGTEKKLQHGIGRPFAKSEAHRSIQEKFFDEENDNYKVKKYDYADLVADDMRANEIYNNSLHPNQKKYKGMTRMDVLLSNQNTSLRKVDKAVIARYAGEKVTTTIRRNQYVQVQYEKYTLSDPAVMEKLAPNNRTVEAYYMPADVIDTVYIYQNDQLIDECVMIDRFQEAKAEQTEKDIDQFTRQQKYISKYDKQVKDVARRIARVSIEEVEALRDNEIDPEIIDTSPDKKDDENWDFDYNENDWKQRALDNL